MKLVLSFILLMFTVCWSPGTLAIDCYYGGKGGPVDKSVTIPSFAIPSTIGTGEKIWVSPIIKVPVYCDNNTQPDGQDEKIALWVSPQSGASDPYFQPGITFEGADHDAEGGPDAVDTGQCVGSASSGSQCTGGTPTSRRFVARIRFYVRLKQRPPHDYVSTLSAIPLIAFAGYDDVSSNGHNLKYTLTGLNNIRVLDCGVHLSVSPENEVVNFGTFSTRDIQRHNITRTFTVKATRAEDAECSDGFKLNAAFFTDEHLSADRLLLRPGNGLQLQLLSGTEPVGFERFNSFADFTTGELSVEKEYHAELSPVPGQDIKPGSFTIVVLLRINYH
ncbi:type 1 fimbrial protein [Salmonella enterica]